MKMNKSVASFSGVLKTGMPMRERTRTWEEKEEEGLMRRLMDRANLQKIVEDRDRVRRGERRKPLPIQHQPPSVDRRSVVSDPGQTGETEEEEMEMTSNAGEETMALRK